MGKDRSGELHPSNTSSINEKDKRHITISEGTYCKSRCALYLMIKKTAKKNFYFS